MEEDKKPQFKKLIIDIPLEYHQEIKVRAIMRNVTIKAWVLQAIIDRIKLENSHQ